MVFLTTRSVHNLQYSVTERYLKSATAISFCTTERRDIERDVRFTVLARILAFLKERKYKTFFFKWFLSFQQRYLRESVIFHEL